MYGEFSQIYDLLMDDFDYPVWAEYYLDLLKRQGFSSGEICECGCGTGSLSLELLRRGARLICSDISPDMLRVASQKALKNGFKTRFVQQDMRKLELPHKVDAVICACDGLNYLLTDADVDAFFIGAFNALKSGGVICFDISSQYKLEHILGNDFFCEERENVAYLWQNTYDPIKSRTTMNLTFFIRVDTGDNAGLYKRFDERHLQRAHDAFDLLGRLKAAGFENATLYGDQTFELPHERELRIHISARKPRV